MSDMQIIETHYGYGRTIWRVTSKRKYGELVTLGKFSSREQAENYIKIRIQQQQAKEHNQW